MVAFILSFISSLNFHFFFSQQEIMFLLTAQAKYGTVALFFAGCSPGARVLRERNTHYPTFAAARILNRRSQSEARPHLVAVLGRAWVQKLGSKDAVVLGLAVPETKNLTLQMW